MIGLTMFLVMAIIVYCIDISGFVLIFRSAVKIPLYRPYREINIYYDKECTRRVKHEYVKLTDQRFDKPFFCSQCITFWIGVLLAIINLSWYWLLYGCLFSWLSTYFAMFITVLQDLFIYLYNIAINKLNK